MTFVERLKLAMDERGLDQSGLGRLAGLQKSTVSRVFSGDIKEPGLSRVAALADALDVRAEWLAFGVEPMTRDKFSDRCRPRADAVRRASKALEEAVSELRKLSLPTEDGLSEDFWYTQLVALVRKRLG